MNSNEFNYETKENIVNCCLNLVTIVEILCTRLASSGKSTTFCLEKVHIKMAARVLHKNFKSNIDWNFT